MKSGLMMFQSPRNRVNTSNPDQETVVATLKKWFQSPRNRVNTSNAVVRAGRLRPSAEFQSPRNRVNTSNVLHGYDISRKSLFCFNPLEIGSTLQMVIVRVGIGALIFEFQSPRNRVNTSNRSSRSKRNNRSPPVSIP